jgi:tetratricopeptide (TPR) repeat protein
MIQLNQAHAVIAHNEDSIQELLWEISASKGQFSLVLARCDYTSLRQQMIQQIITRSVVDIRQFHIPESAKRLYSSIREALASQQPDALMLIGLESVHDLDQMLVAVNQVREEFRKNFSFSIVMWVTDEVLKKLIRLAPDFESWSTTTAFTLPTVTLIQELQHLTDRLFTQIADLGDAPTLSHGTVWNAQYRHELAAALRDLQTRHQQLEPGLTAGLEFAFGLSDYSRDEIDSALSHYRTSLEFWQSAGQPGRQGILLFYLGLCYARRAEQYGSDQCFCWEEARHYFQAAIDHFEQAQRTDLVAKFINQLGKVLQYQEKWSDLSALAEKSLQLQKTYNDSYRMAQANAFLAEVALQQSRWRDAKQYAEQAIDLNSQIVSEQPSQQGLYLLLLAKALQGLGNSPGAVANLEKAKEIGPQDTPKLYVQVLEALRELYFKQKRYFDAFCLKQERLSIEQQYGLRAFIGAGRLKSQRQARTMLGLAEQRAMAAQEIAASGRQQNIQQLLERIGSTQHRLTILYGQSGVGKSSLVEAGLIPTLKQTSIGTYDVLPILLRVYTHWVEELGQTLTDSLETLPLGPIAKTTCQSLPEILDQLKRHERYNLLTVIIFDQFEEFFFIYKNVEERKRFFKFLQDCLNLPSIKVIISLREDYLHYLLSGSRSVNLDVINNNILDKDILYYIGNFSEEEANSFCLKLCAHYLQLNGTDFSAILNKIINKSIYQVGFK